MTKKQTKKHGNQLKSKQIEHSEQQFDEEFQDNLDNQQKSTRKLKQDNSLSILTKKFIQLIKSDPNLTIDINQAVRLLKVQKRRIYDITNVLEGINYVKKVQKNMIKWVKDDENEQQKQKTSKQLQKKYTRMVQQCKQIEQKTSDIYREIKDEYLQNIEMKPYLYLSYDDCKSICDGILKDEDDKSMIIMSGNNGVQLQHEQLQNKLIISCSGGLNSLKILTYSNNQLKQFHPNRK